jgi:hypothetical protein
MGASTPQSIIGLDDLDIVSTRNPDGTLTFTVRGPTGIEVIEAQAKLLDMTLDQYVADALCGFVNGT